MLEATVDLLGELVSFPTVSSDSNLVMAGVLAERLEQAGGRVELMQDPSGSKANLWASFGPEGPGGLVISGHMDVVPVAEQPWSVAPFVMSQAEGKLFGRGTCDMKGFIAAAIVAAPMFAQARRPVHFAFTYDEEVGCLGAQHLVAGLAKRAVKPAMAVIGEPTEMRVIEGHKGCCEYTTRFTGLEGHGSAPDLGVNAVEYAARYVGRLLDLREALKRRAPEGSRFVPPWSTLNLGRVQGGVAHNVIASQAELAWEMRPVVQADAEFVKSNLDRYVADELLPAMQAVDPNATIDTEVIAEIVGLEPMSKNAARDLVAALTGANGADVVPFGTEAGLFQELGMDVVVCGPGSIAQAHKADEYVEIDQLNVCLGFLDRLARKWVAQPQLP